jgi:signal transduction histidine kinase/ligand-binding sensor domain-containing protein/DNA-binding response OmpR family regulator
MPEIIPAPVIYFILFNSLREMSDTFKYMLVLYFFCLQISYPQNLNFRFGNIKAEQGLSTNTVFCITQDSRGFLWIGTYDGLNRYDGYNFKIYRNISSDSTSISENKIRAICEDDNGNLWIGTWGGGLNKFDRNTETFTRFMHNPEDKSSLSHNSVFSIAIDRNGELWIGTAGGGLNKLEKGSNKFIRYNYNPDDDNSIGSDMIFSICKDSMGELWIASHKGGLCKYDYTNDNFLRFNHDPSDPESLSSDALVTIYEDRQSTLWIGTSDAGLNQFNPENQTFKKYYNNSSDPLSLSDNAVYSIYDCKDGNLWIGTYSGGINLFNKDTGKFIRFINYSGVPNSIGDNFVFSIFEDRSGILWLGTWNNGLFTYDSYREKFRNYSYNPNNPNGLNSNSISAIFEDSEGVVWIGTTSEGLNRFDKKENKFRHFLHDPKNPQSISSNIINSICEDKSGNIWIGTDGGGVNRLDKKSFKFTAFRNNPGEENCLSSDRITAILIDKYNKLWVGIAGGGINKYDIANNKFIKFEPDPHDPYSISEGLVYSIYEDRSGALWIGTMGGGLNKFDRQTGRFLHYQHNANDPASLSNNTVSCILEDSEGNIWVGTQGEGINKFDKSSGRFTHYKEVDGLPNNVIYGMIEDDSGNLWISTNKGLSRFNYRLNTFRNYDIEDGLQDNEFNQWSYFKSKHGTMFFGGNNGFNIFHPDSINESTYIVPVLITDFQLLHKPVSIGYDARLGKSILSKSIIETEMMELDHNENIISFELTAIDFHSSEKIHYAYYLEGYEKDWNYADAKKRFITYTNLNPGEYTLRVKASNKDGVWNEEGTFLKIIISPPWWATTWAYAIYIVFFLSVLYGIRRYEMNRLNWKNQVKLDEVKLKEKEETNRMKSRFFANISHEFRTPLMLILGPAENIFDKITDEDLKKQAGLIKGNANKLLGLINQLLDLSKIEAGKLKIQASSGNIAAFVKGIAMEFESMAERKDITLSFLNDKKEIQAYFDKDKMEKIITNVIANALKFTPENGRVTIEVKTKSSVLQNENKEEFVEIIVRDTGIGIPSNELTKIFDRFYQVNDSHTREHEGTGIGLALTKEFVELHHGQILIESEEGKGTTVKIILPLGSRHFSKDEIIEASGYEFYNSEISKYYSKKSSVKNEPDYEQFDNKTVVLVVEDNTDLREYIRDALKLNYQIEEAANGEQGLRKAEKIIPDLIISDIMMPKMDGCEMTKSLKVNEKTSHIPVILLTAKSEKESRLDGFRIGADAYLTKPFDTKELLVRIDNLISTRKKLQEIYGRGEIAEVKNESKRLSIYDENFLKKVNDAINKNITDENFSIEDFSSEIGMSRTQLHRKLKALTGKSASRYLRSVRLSKAAKLLAEQKQNISEVAYSVGFASPQYFTRCFRDEFGHPPSELVH